jgi:hypothetical protein
LYHFLVSCDIQFFICYYIYIPEPC